VTNSSTILRRVCYPNGNHTPDRADMEHDSALQRDITDVIARHGPVTATEIAAKLDEHPLRVQRYCRGLQRNQRLIQVLGGGYVLANSTEYVTRIASD